MGKIHIDRTTILSQSFQTSQRTYSSGRTTR